MYGLKWRDYPEENEHKNFIFKEVEELNIGSEGIEHKLIEGDNLLALRKLQESYEGGIDVIYIDPPYNTGNEFVYQDKFKDIDKHSKWLSFMYKRLRLAKKLLSDEGVIFVSIDDNEQAQLKLLMDKVFGEEHFLANVIRQESPKRQKKGRVTIQTEHEYVLVYSKTKSYTLKYPSNNDYLTYNNEVQKLYKKYKDSKVVTNIITNKHPIEQYDDATMRIKLKIERLQERNRGLKQYKYYDPHKKKVFRTSDIAMYVGGGVKNYKLFHNGKNIKIPKKGLPSIEKLKQLVSIDVDEEKKEIHITDDVIEIEDGRYLANEVIFKYGTILDYKNVIEFETVPVTDMRDFTGSDDRLLQSMSIDFNFPKRVDLIKYLVNLHKKDDAVVLDFFAGSGTTGHAVMELNKEDGGNRQFILCTNNEVSESKEREYLAAEGYIEKPHKRLYNKFKKEHPEQYEAFLRSEEYQQLGIARAVTRERLKRVIEGYTTPKGKEVEGLDNNKITYFKID